MREVVNYKFRKGELFVIEGLVLYFDGLVVGLWLYLYLFGGLWLINFFVVVENY